MARLHRYDWIKSQCAEKGRAKRRRNRTAASKKPCWRPSLELLESRNLLSASSGVECETAAEPVNSSLYEEAAAQTQWASKEEFEASGSGFEEFNAVVAWPDSNLREDGFQLTYSYSNLLNGELLGGLTPLQIRAATEEALNLWAAVAPLHFQEVVDSGPAPGDDEYPAGDTPDIRIGHHFIDGTSNVLAHAFFPVFSDGLAGDVHFDAGDVWVIGQSDRNSWFDIVEVMTHELGHSLGLGHEFVNDAIMNPFYGSRFDGLGTGFLLEDDIAGIQDLYGEGVGSVTPLRPLFVDSLMDENDGDTSENNLSLREAIDIAAMTGQDVGFVEALAGGTIELDPELGSLVIPAGIGINGLGSDLLTIQAPDPTPDEANGDGLQIFIVSDDDPETTLDADINGLTLTGADSATAGGAIFSAENLTLEDVRLAGNASAEAGGGVYSAGSVSLISSSVEDNAAGGNGGGVFGMNGVSIESTTVANNESGGRGGGVAAFGEQTRIKVINSTISNNESSGDGGGINIFDVVPESIRIEHSTITQNIAGGSGGGIFERNGLLILDHSIVAQNSDNGSAPDIDNINFLATPAVLSLFSIVGDGTGALIDEHELGGNTIGTAVNPVDAMLGPLQINGGKTKTHNAMTGSPAIDAGDENIVAPPEFDQRGLGFDRIESGVVDIGAVESTGFQLTWTVDTLEDELDEEDVNNEPRPGDFSLREAIARANAEVGQDRILFDASLGGLEIMLNPALGEISIIDSVTIDASDLVGGLTINAGSDSTGPVDISGEGFRLFNIDRGDLEDVKDVTFEGLTLTGADVAGDGGAIRSLENLTLRQVTVENNSATGRGGGLYHKNGTLLIERSTFAHNAASGDGGGLWTDTSVEEGQEGQILQSTFSGNESGDEGGGVFNFDGRLLIDHSTITNNEADWGGGVVSYGDQQTETVVFSSIIAGNTGLDAQISRNLAFNSFESGGYNVIGIGNAFLDFDNNDQFEVVDPMLGPLANNGGPTQTHAPLAGSPVIDASDPNLIAPGEDLPEFDQRGEPFGRLVDGNNDETATLDVGAVEREGAEPDADFNTDGIVDGTDLMAWMRGFGIASDASQADGDANSDGAVDGEDRVVWEEQFGRIGPAEISMADQPNAASIVENVGAVRAAEASGKTPFDVAAVALHWHIRNQDGNLSAGNAADSQDADQALTSVIDTERVGHGGQSAEQTWADLSRGEDQTEATHSRRLASGRGHFRTLDAAFAGLDNQQLRGL